MAEDHTPEVDVRLEKAVWTEADFDRMSWHDATIHAVAFEYPGDAGYGSCRVLFDIDYIVSWVQPVLPAESFRFWVAPATLVFEDVVLVEIEQEVDESSGPVQMKELSRGAPKDESERRWMDETGVAPWELDEIGAVWTSTGFRQHFRRLPIYGRVQLLESRERGGISFDQPRDFEDSAS